MISVIKKIFMNNNIQNNNSIFNISSSVKIIFGKNSKIYLNKCTVLIGYPLAFKMPYSSKPKTIIKLGDNSQIIFNGDTRIAPGASVNVKDNGSLVFHGNNLIAHDSLIFCSKFIEIGEGSSISWNVTLMDDDGHTFFTNEGDKIRSLYKPLVIGKNVGIQMGVMIPRGIKIGDNSIISAGTILRNDISDNCCAFTNPTLKVHNGITSGLQQT